MTKEEEQLDYENTLLEFYTACTQYGCRTVLTDFKTNFPDIYDELIIQALRLKPDKQEAALLRARPV